MTTWVLGFTFYLFSLFLFFLSCSPLMTWLLMEINLLSFISLFFLGSFKSSLQDLKEASLFYFIIQSVASLIFLFSLILSESMSWFNYSFIFVLALSLKLGIFPLFFWILKLGSSLSIFILILVLSLQKLPMFFILFQSSSWLMFIFLCFSFAVGAVLVFWSKSLVDVLVGSSISSSFWVLNFFDLSIWVYFLFNMFYFLTLVLLFCGNSPFSMDWFCNFLYIFLCGLPPFSLFFFKVYVITPSLENFDGFFFLVMWLVTFTMLMCYTSFFYFNFFSKNFLYFTNEFAFKKMSFLFLGLVLFPFFFLL